MTAVATEPARISSMGFSLTAVVDDVFQAQSRKRDQRFRTGDSLDGRDQVSTALGAGLSFQFVLGPAAIGPSSPSVLELVQPILQAAKTLTRHDSDRPQRGRVTGHGTGHPAALTLPSQSRFVWGLLCIDY